MWKLKFLEDYKKDLEKRKEGVIWFNGQTQKRRFYGTEFFKDRKGQIIFLIDEKPVEIVDANSIYCAMFLNGRKTVKIVKTDNNGIPIIMAYFSYMEDTKDLFVTCYMNYLYTKPKFDDEVLSKTTIIF